MEKTVRSKCDECVRPPEMGTRCMLHYTRRFARRMGLLDLLWYLSHEDDFVTVLRARSYVIAQGEMVPPTDGAEFFCKGSLPAKKHSWKKHRGNIVRIIEAVDNMTRRNSEAANSNREDSAGRGV